MLNPKVLLIGWAVMVVGGFWQFKGLYMVPVPPVVPPPALGTAERPFVTGQVGTLVVAWNPDCPCSRSENAHMARLAETFLRQGVSVRVLVTATPGAQSEAEQGWVKAGLPMSHELDENGVKAEKLGISATPGAVLLDNGGRIVYRGSLHAARFCDSDDLAFAQRAMEQLVRGERIAHPEIPFYGCALPGHPR